MVLFYYPSNRFLLILASLVSSHHSMLSKSNTQRPHRPASYVCCLNPRTVLFPQFNQPSLNTFKRWKLKGKKTVANTRCGSKY